MDSVLFTYGHLEMVGKMTTAIAMVMLPLCGRYLWIQQSMTGKLLFMTKVVLLLLPLLLATVEAIGQDLEW